VPTLFGEQDAIVAASTPRSQKRSASTDPRFLVNPKRLPKKLKFGERVGMLVEANRAARRGELVNGHRIQPFDVAVLMELDSHYNMEEGTTFPSQETIALNLGCAQPSVSQSIARLVACGYITKSRRGRTVIYRFAGPLWAHYMEIKRDRQAPATHSLEAMSEPTDEVSHSLENDPPHSPQAMSPHSPQAMCKEPVFIEPVFPSPSPSLPSPAETTETPTTKSAPQKTGASATKSGRFIDALKAQGIKVHMREQDHRALKKVDADPEFVAEVYAAVFNGQFGDDWIQNHLNVQTVLGVLDGYAAKKKNPYAHKRASNKGPEPGTLTNW
jgi:biotin operon repressor